MNPHKWIEVLSEPGTENPKWQCVYCRAFDTYDKLHAIECSYVYPPCRFCGETPTCAPFCSGITDLLECECWKITETYPTQNGDAWLAAYGIFAHDLLKSWAEGERPCHHPRCPERRK